MKPLVIGATNLDHTLQLKAPLRMHDSNPVTVHPALGGVGFNLMSHLAALTDEAHFLTAFKGPLPFASYTAIPLKKTPAYYAVMASDMVVGFADMDDLETLQPSPFLDPVKALKKDDMLLADLNFPVAFLAPLFEASKAPVYVDATSAHKVAKCVALMPHLTGLKLNRVEAESLTKKTDLESIIRVLETYPIPEIIVTLGPAGIVHVGQDVIFYHDQAPFDAFNLSGVGDAFMAGLYARMDAFRIERAFALAALTARSSSTTVPGLTDQALEKERSQRHVIIQKRRPRRPQ